jgi:hypothetical protein
MSPSAPKGNSIIQHFREQAEAAQAACELAEPQDKVAALLRFDQAVQELGNALLEQQLAGQDY